MLNSCTPVKYILLPVAKKFPDFVEAIFVHELIDKVYFWSNVSRTFSDPSVTYSMKPDLLWRMDELSHLKLDRFADATNVLLTICEREEESSV
jgi:hypothetical protein